MVDREKVIKGLECCVEKLDTVVNKSHGFNCIVCPYFRKCDRSGYFIGFPLMRDALALLKKSFTPQEVYDIVVEHAQHDMRFKLGDKIDYSITDVVDILNIEVMCKAGDM